eukprot:13029055-Alexandrium_andersonii.AAC.1
MRPARGQWHRCAREQGLTPARPQGSRTLPEGHAGMRPELQTESGRVRRTRKSTPCPSTQRSAMEFRRT